MDSTQWVVSALVASFIVLLLLCCCCCCFYCWCKKKGKVSSFGLHRSSKISPEFLESGGGGFEPAQPLSEENTTVYNCGQDLSNHDTHNCGIILGPASTPSTDFQHGDIPLISLGPPANSPSLSIDTISHYIADVVIPRFVDHRNGYQFAVVILLSENDCRNIYKVKFIPCDHQGNPLVDASQCTMPPCIQYCNYIVARPTLRAPMHCHSEVEIFGDRSNTSRFDLLWNAYVKHHLAAPDYILMYSWNLPCSNCTDTIIQSLRNAKYKSAKVIVAHTIKWRGEPSSQHDLSEEKLVRESIIVQEVKYPHRITKSYV